MGALVAVEADAILDASSGTSAYTNPTTPIKVALDTVIGSSTSPGTEVSGGSYARQTITFNAASAEGNTSSDTQTYTSMPSCTVVAVDEWDSAGSPVRRWWGALTANKVVNSGDTFTIASGSYSKTLS
jgi:hypothetical protein